MPKKSSPLSYQSEIGVEAEVDTSCRSIPDFVVGVFTRTLVSMITECSSKNTAYWGDGINLSRRDRTTFASRLADWLTKLCFNPPNLQGSVQSCDTCIFIRNTVDKHTYQTTEECFPTLSKGKNPKSGHVKCIYTHVVWGNKQEELQLCAQFESYDVIGIAESWWESTGGWKTTMDGYKFFWKDRKWRRGSAVVRYVKEKSECTEVSYGDHESSYQMPLDQD